MPAISGYWPKRKPAFTTTPGGGTTGTGGVGDTYSAWQQQVPQPPPQVSTGPSPFESAAFNYWQQQTRQPGIDERTQQLMRNRLAATQARDQSGNTQAIKDYYSRMGLSGSGQEQRALQNAMAGGGAALQSGLTGIDIQNALAALQNRMGLVGTGFSGASALGQLGLGRERLGEEARQFGQTLGSDIFRYGRDTDLSRQYYDKQLEEYRDILNKIMEGNRRPYGISTLLSRPF